MTSSTFHIKEHVLECQHIREYPRATALSQEDVFKLAIKQYTPIDNPNPQPGDVTLIGAHANGFPKELYEPLWVEIHARSKTNGFRIRNIWIADASHQGTSGVLNEHLLGNDPSWMDHVRDLLHMINHFRAEMPLPMMGIGHSMGANQLVNLALMHPRLLHSLVLIDPVIQPHMYDPTTAGESGRAPARLSTFRRDIWPTRSAAVASFRKQPYYQAWDKRVFDLWVQYGMRDTPTALYPDEREGAVTLTTTKDQEVWTFLRPKFRPSNGEYDVVQREAYPDIEPELMSGMPFYRPEPPMTFSRLPNLRPSTLYVFGGDSYLSSPSWRADKMRVTGVGLGGSGGVKEGRVKEVTLEGIGHLVAMEAVERCADPIAEWTGKELQRWEKQKREFEEWTRIPFRERQIVTEEWKEKLGGPVPKMPMKGKI